MMWLLGLVLALVVGVIVLCWFGLRKVLIKPLNDSIQHIEHIAQGDLTQTITVEGRNEMSQLASKLQEMQQALVRTVSNVRDGSDAILPAPAKSPPAQRSRRVPSSRRRRWSRLRPAWSSSPPR